MTGAADLYKYKAILLPWNVRSVEDLIPTYPVAVSAWHDGDTFNCMVSRGEHDYLMTHVRCAGYNAPELRSGKPGADAAIYARSLVEAGGIVYLDSLAFSNSDQEDSFGRMLAKVTLKDGRDLSELMLANTASAKG
jgi:endonuclease YncB( thermonuclease family)